LSAVISIALPVFAVIAAGMFAGYRNILKKEDSGALNRFVFNFAMPAALFGLMAKADLLTLADGKFALSYAIAATVVIFGAYAIGQSVLKLEAETAGAHAFTSTLGNAVFLGLPIALALPGWAENFVILMLVEGIFIIAIGAALMSPRGGGATFLIRPFKNPLVVAMIAGLVFSILTNLFGFVMPSPVTSFFDILGRAAGPTALFSMGLFLSTNPTPAIAQVGGRVGTIFLMKMIVMPALTLGGLFVLGIHDPLLLGPAALFTFVPTGVGAYIMASQYGRYETEAAAAIAFTTAVSVFTISGVLAIFA